MHSGKKGQDAHSRDADGMLCDAEEFKHLRVEGKGRKELE